MPNDFLESDANPSVYPDDYDPNLNGIGGWMILIIIGRFASIIQTVLIVPRTLSLLGFQSEVDVLLTVLLAVIIPLTVVTEIIILVLIFKKKILFRKVMTIYIIVNMAILLALTIYRSIALDDFDGTIIVSFISAAIWITYLYKSKRVKNTYIYPSMDFAQVDNSEAVQVQEIDEAGQNKNDF